MTVPLLNSLPTKREMRTDMSKRGVAGEEGQQLAGGAELVLACGNAFHGHIHAASSRAACSCVSWASMESPASL